MRPGPLSTGIVTRPAMPVTNRDGSSATARFCRTSPMNRSVAMASNATSRVRPAAAKARSSPLPVRTTMRTRGWLRR